jgi:hypothetical protein
MRIVAGIMLIIAGMYLLNFYASLPNPSNRELLTGFLVLIIPAAFLVTSGVFCLIKRHWRVCLAGACVAGFFMILFMGYLNGGGISGLAWLSWVFSILGTFSVVFVVLTKEDWQKSQT